MVIEVDEEIALDLAQLVETKVIITYNLTLTHITYRKRRTTKSGWNIDLYWELTIFGLMAVAKGQLQGIRRDCES